MIRKALITLVRGYKLLLSPRAPVMRSKHSSATAPALAATLHCAGSLAANPGATAATMPCHGSALASSAAISRLLPTSPP